MCDKNSFRQIENGCILIVDFSLFNKASYRLGVYAKIEHVEVNNCFNILQ